MPILLGLPQPPGGKMASDAERAEPYFKAAQLAKDRLHTLQSTEWNMYYAIWLVLLATMYGIMTAFGGVLPVIGDGLYKLLEGVPDSYHVRSILVRTCRAIVFAGMVWVFFRQVKSYYLTDFYKANYKSLVTQRILYYLYVGKALQIAYGSDEKNVPPVLRYQVGGEPLTLDELAGVDAPDVAPKPHDQPPKSPGWLARLFAWLVNPIHILTASPFSTWMRRHWLGDPIHMPQKSDARVEELLLPGKLRAAAEDYRNSGVYAGRTMVMLRVTRLGVLMAALVSFFSPIHAAAH
jgi:hypothetical protein